MESLSSKKILVLVEFMNGTVQLLKHWEFKDCEEEEKFFEFKRALKEDYKKHLWKTNVLLKKVVCFQKM